MAIIPLAFNANLLSELSAFEFMCRPCVESTNIKSRAPLIECRVILVQMFIDHVLKFFN